MRKSCKSCQTYAQAQRHAWGARLGAEAQGLWLWQKPASPKYPPQHPNHRKNLIVLGRKKSEPPNFMAPKDAETKQPIQVLHAAHTRVSLGAGRGRAAMPPPYQKMRKRPSLFWRRGGSAVPECSADFPRGCDPYAVLLETPWRKGPPLQDQASGASRVRTPDVVAPETLMPPPRQLSGRDVAVARLYPLRRVRVMQYFGGLNPSCSGDCRTTRPAQRQTHSPTFTGLEPGFQPMKWVAR